MGRAGSKDALFTPLPTFRVVPRGAATAYADLFSDLCDDVHRHFFNLARDPLAPSAAFAFGSASHALRAATSVVRAQFRADCKSAWGLAKKAGKASLKALIEARVVEWDCSGLRVDELALLGTLAPSLPALETLTLYKLSPEDALCFFEALLPNREGDLLSAHVGLAGGVVPGRISFLASSYRWES